MKTRKWADTQRNGRPAEYRWRPLLNAAKFASRPLLECSNADNIGEGKNWTQSEFCTWLNSVRGKSPQKCIYSVPSQDMAKIMQSLVDLRQPMLVQ